MTFLQDPCFLRHSGFVCSWSLCLFAFRSPLLFCPQSYSQPIVHRSAPILDGSQVLNHLFFFKKWADFRCIQLTPWKIVTLGLFCSGSLYVTDTVDLKPFGFVLVCLSPRGATNRLALVAVGPLTPEGSRERSYYKRHGNTNLVQTLGRCQAPSCGRAGRLVYAETPRNPAWTDYSPDHGSTIFCPSSTRPLMRSERASRAIRRASSASFRP